MSLICINNKCKQRLSLKKNYSSFRWISADEDKEVKRSLSLHDNVKRFSLDTATLPALKNYQSTLINSHFSNYCNINDGFNNLDQHSKQVSIYCKMIAHELELQPNEILEFEMAGLLHDIGKISIPDSILNKPTVLTREEWKIMKTHTIIGYEILKNDSNYSHLANYARSHHERFDGKGYPDGLKGENIPFIARVIAVADAYEAMTSDRPYRQALPVEVAISELQKHSGTHFDPKLVKLFVDKIIDF